MDQDRYNEEELARILREAATAQADASAATESGTGFSVDEISSMASEVGIDPKFVTQAAEQVSQSRDRPKRKYLFGAPTVDILERTCEGVLDDEGWQDLVTRLRSVFGSDGVVSSMGSAREWKGGSDTTSAHMSATERNGRTKYRLMINRTGAVYLGWAIGISVSFVTLLVLLIQMNETRFFINKALVLPAVACMLFAFIRSIISHNAVRGSARVDTLMGQLKELTRPALQTSLPAKDANDETLTRRLIENA